MNIIVLSALLLTLPATGAEEGWAQPMAAPASDGLEAELSAHSLSVPTLPWLEQVASELQPLGEDAATNSEILEAARGREGGTASAVLGGIVTGNTALNVSSGANYITEGSFANMSGLPVVIQNSGANVLIQNATVINLQLR